MSELQIEKIARDRYRLRFREQIITLDAQALLDLMDYGLRYARTLEQERDEPRSIREALAETSSEFASGFSEETQLHQDDEPTSGPRRVNWDALLDS
jgi:hypothetical protein